MRNDVPSVIKFYDVRAENLDHCLALKLLLSLLLWITICVK